MNELKFREWRANYLEMYTSERITELKLGKEHFARIANTPYRGQVVNLNAIIFNGTLNPAQKITVLKALIFLPWTHIEINPNVRQAIGQAENVVLKSETV